MEYINDPNKEFLNSLILSKDNISEQLKLLRKYKDREDIQEYINNLKENKISDYMKYQIEKYYEGNKNAIKREKVGPERVFKVLLRPVQIRKKKEKPVETDIKVGDTVLVSYRSLEPRKITEEDKAIVENIDKEYGIATIKQNFFGEKIIYDIDIKDIQKLD